MALHSVVLPPQFLAQELTQGRANSDSLGWFCGTASRCVPRGVRLPPASSYPQRHHASQYPVLCLGARTTFALSREGACEPWSRHPQSFPQGPQACWTPRARPGPRSERDASYRGSCLERGGLTEGCGPKPAGARRAPSSLSAWAAAASASGASAQGVRLNTAPAARTPSAQSRPT